MLCHFEDICYHTLLQWVKVLETFRLSLSEILRDKLPWVKVIEAFLLSLGDNLYDKLLCVNVIVAYLLGNIPMTSPVFWQRRHFCFLWPQGMLLAKIIQLCSCLANAMLLWIPGYATHAPT